MQGPVYLRLARLATGEIYDKEQKFEIGKGKANRRRKRRYDI